MRPVLGSTATTAPLYRPSPSTAAARTIGSSKVATSASEELAKVGTPRKRETWCMDARCMDARRAAGEAGMGEAMHTARTAARKTRPVCVTLGSENYPTFSLDEGCLYPRQ